MTIIVEAQAHIVRLTDLSIDLIIAAIPVLDVDHVHNQGTNRFNITLLPIDLHQVPEILKYSDPDHTLKPKKNKLSNIHTESSNSPINFEDHM